MPIPRGAPEPTVCLRQLFQSVTISRQQQLTDKESFKHGRDWLSRFKRFFYSQRKTYHKRSECLLRNNNDGLRTKNIPRRTFILSGTERYGFLV